MSTWRAALSALLFMLALAAGGAAHAQDAEAPDAEALEHWNDFMHYGLIARQDLAAASGEKLLAAELEPAELLRVVEASRYAERYVDDLATFQQMEGAFADVAAQVASAIETARLSVARDPKRIQQSIAKLDDSLRARLNAIRRLRVAGEHAAPELLHVIAGDAEGAETLRPYVLEAVVQLGRPMVLPMAEGLSTLPDKSQAQLARALGRIGYPAAMPFLKQLSENAEASEETRQAARAALARIAAHRGITIEASAAALFLDLAEDFYAGRSSMILAPEASTNMVWYVDEQAPEPDIDPAAAPTAVFPDVMAMRMARRALRLDPSMERALQLWLAANYRRENRLPQGERLPQKLTPARSTAFYGRMAGPRHLKPVLARALDARDAALALDAIRGMRQTGGRESLVGDAGVLLSAMNYPDGRIRLEAALAVARSNPQTEFPGSDRVVPLLAEAANLTAQPRALVIASPRPVLNELSAKLRETGEYRILQAETLDATPRALAEAPAVDLVIVHGERSVLRQFRQRRAVVAKLKAAPAVVLPRPDEMASANAIFGDAPLVVVAQNGEVTPGRLEEAVDQAVAAARGEPITDAEALASAERALDALRDLALRDNPLFDVAVARDPLIEALNNQQTSVATGAAAVLARLPSPAAQRAIADAALAANQPAPRRVALLEALAESFKRFGAQLRQPQAEALQALVQNTEGEVADAAAQAFGAGDMPTRQIVELIAE